MKISMINSTSFNGRLFVDTSCKFAQNKSIKDFGEYVKENTAANLDVFIVDMPEAEGRFVETFRATDAWEAQREQDRVNDEWLENGGSAADIPGGYPSFGPNNPKYTGSSAKENLKISYKSPNASAMSGFYLDESRDSGSVLKYLIENLKNNTP